MVATVAAEGSVIGLIESMIGAGTDGYQAGRRLGTLIRASRSDHLWLAEFASGKLDKLQEAHR